MEIFKVCNQLLHNKNFRSATVFLLGFLIILGGNGLIWNVLKIYSLIGFIYWANKFFNSNNENKKNR